MKTKMLIAIYPLLMLATPLASADQELAMVVNSGQSTSIDYKRVTDYLNPESKKSKPKPKSSLRSYLVSVREDNTQDEFNQILNKHYPLNFKMLTTLTTEEQQAIFMAFKQGERIRDLRKQVITSYAGNQQP